uniref:GDT1 family protein n=1 Tax=Elaeophora elaphi TaxID=1147741 RepID=A0A0R3RWL7_9BILA
MDGLLASVSDSIWCSNELSILLLSFPLFMMKFVNSECLIIALLSSYFSGFARGAIDLWQRGADNIGNFSLLSSAAKEVYQQEFLKLDHADKDLAAILVENKPKKSIDLTLYHALLASISVIIVSELGDKTWFIAAIMAMRHSRLTVFSGAMAALILMTLLSAGLGWFTQIMPRLLTYSISTALFALFGLKMLYDGYRMSPADGQEGYAEAKTEIQKKEQQKELLSDSSKVPDMETGGINMSNQSSRHAFLSVISTLFLEVFTLTFLAEWGDRSQLTTIVLAARENIYGVVIGTILGHAFCTGIAVIGGRLVAAQISVRTVTLIGGVVFILFAFSAFFVSPELE